MWTEQISQNKSINNVLHFNWNKTLENMVLESTIHRLITEYSEWIYQFISQCVHYKYTHRPKLIAWTQRMQWVLVIHCFWLLCVTESHIIDDVALWHCSRENKCMTKTLTTCYFASFHFAHFLGIWTKRDGRVEKLPALLMRFACATLFRCVVRCLSLSPSFYTFLSVAHSRCIGYRMCKCEQQSRIHCTFSTSACHSMYICIRVCDCVVLCLVYGHFKIVMPNDDGSKKL